MELLFRTTGRTYVQTFEFAQSLLVVARDDSERAMAYAWGAHLAADPTGERSEANLDGYIPEAEPLHQLVEVAVDTVVFYDFPPPAGFTSWTQINVSFDAGLLFRASVHYNRQVKRVPQVWPGWRPRPSKAYRPLSLQSTIILNSRGTHR